MNKKGVVMFGYDTKEEMFRLDLERDVYVIRRIESGYLRWLMRVEAPKTR